MTCLHDWLDWTMSGLGLCARCSLPLLSVRPAAPSSSGGSGRGGAPVTITLTKSKKAKATKRLAGRDAEPLEASADLTDSASHGLFARNLCPACPSGASVSPRSFWDGTWFAPRGVDTVYCESLRIGRGGRPPSDARPGPSQAARAAGEPLR